MRFRRRVDARERFRRTGAGVYVEADDMRRGLASPSPPQKKARLSHRKKARTKKLINLLGVALLLAGSALFSITFGDAILGDQTKASISQTAEATAPPAITEAATASPAPSPAPAVSAGPSDLLAVYVPASGSRYHATPDCSGMKNAREVSIETAAGEGFTPCKRCNPPEYINP